MFFFNTTLFFSSCVVLVIVILKLLLPRRISVSAWSTTVTWFFWFFSCHGFSFSSIQSLSHVWLFETYGLEHSRFPWPSPTPGAYSNSFPSRRWCHPTISSSVVPFSHLQSFPASGSFQMSWFFTSGGQSIGVSASASVLPMNIQDWLPLGWTSWISLQSKGLARVFSDTTVQKHQFFSSQLS